MIKTSKVCKNILDGCIYNKIGKDHAEFILQSEELYVDENFSCF